MGKSNRSKFILCPLLILIVFATNLLGDFQFAKELFDDGLYDEGIKEFQKVISDYPTSKEAEESYFYIGQSYREQGRYDLAEKSFNQIWQGYPDSDFKDRTLYYLALTQKDIGELNDSYNNYMMLVNKFALSNYSHQALKSILEVLYLQKDYQQVIKQGKKIEEEYSNSKQIPFIKLYIAKSELALNNIAQYQEIKDQIIADFKSTNAYWEILLVDVELMKKQNNISTGIMALEGYLENEIPRAYEEIFRAKLLDYYLTEKEYDKALVQSNSLIAKYNNSDSMDKYLTKQLLCKVRVGKINDIDLDGSIPKEVANSPYLYEYILYQAETVFQVDDYEEMTLKLDKIITESEDDYLIYKSNLLKTKALNEQGRYVETIAELQKLSLEKWSKADFIDLNIADIYFTDLEFYNQAIIFYDKVVSGYNDDDIVRKAQYKKALCFENINDYSTAVEQLNMIDIYNSKDQKFIQMVREKKSYLTKFKVIDYRSAFVSLVEAIYNFSESDDSFRLKTDMIDVLANEVKDYKAGIALVNPDKDTSIYLKLNLLLLEAEKMKAENNDSEVGELITQFDDLMPRLLAEDFIEEKVQLELKRDLILEDKVNESLELRMVTFIRDHPEADGSNEFILSLLDYYRENNEINNVVSYQKALVLDDKIDENLFFEEKLALAEYYYSKDQDQLALENYELGKSAINIDKPQILFHYAVVNNQLGNNDTADSKLELLVNNATNFSGYSNALNYYVDFLIDKQEYEEALNYSKRVEISKRDDRYYTKSALLFKALGQNEEAKVALMHIPDKSIDILEDLAHLQFVTGDYVMAEFTYKQLREKNSENLFYTYMSGHIAFILEEYLKAATSYKIVVDKLGDNFSEFEHLETLAKENIIALYKIENRPKAELLTEKFKDNLSETITQILAVNEAIYYLKIDPKKATKILNKVLKEPKDDNVKYLAQYWRGVSYLASEKEAEAEADLLVAMESGDREIINQAALKLGTLKFTQENYEKALDYYYEVIINDSSGKYALDAANNFAIVCKSREEWQKAVAAYEIILEKWGDSDLEGKTIFDIAYCHYRDHKYGEAIKMFNRAIPLLNDREVEAEAQFWKGEAYFSMEDYSDAVTEFLKVGYNYQELTHWAASAELRAADAYDGMDDIVKAKRLYQRVIDKYGEQSQWGKLAVSKLGQY